VEQEESKGGSGDSPPEPRETRSAAGLACPHMPLSMANSVGACFVLLVVAVFGSWRGLYQYPDVAFRFNFDEAEVSV